MGSEALRMATPQNDTADAREAGACNSDDKAVAARVLTLAAEGIQMLASQLDDRFTAAVDLIAGVEGRVVVTGMGKSGHIGGKIAATLASTGTPAFFVHPGEAAHGDLGMITKRDAVLALSNSGETAELDAIIAYTRRFSIPLIGITKSATSNLGSASDIVLQLPPLAEACPMGLAPTTSTTMMLALGDALAVALLDRRGFTSQDFQVLHPGGSLGRKLVRVADLMHKGDALPTVSLDAPMSDVVLEMTAKRFGTAGVLNTDGTLAGIITDGDLRRHMADTLLTQTARNIMTVNPVTIRPQALAAEALGVMTDRPGKSPITVLFVVENNRPVGILHIHDCLHAGLA